VYVWLGLTQKTEFCSPVRKIAVTTVSFVMPVRLSAWNNSVSIEPIFMNLDICVFFENLSRKFKFR